MTSNAISPFTMPAALGAADSILGNPTWIGDACKPEQMAWLESFRRRCDLARNMPEVASHATTNVLDHVAWLATQGWVTQITAGADGDLFLAATLDIVAKWRAVGRAYEQDGIHRVMLTVGAYVSDGSGNPVVEVVTQHPAWSFCFQQVNCAPSTTAELMDVARDMAVRHAHQQVYLDFPMVDLTVRRSADYMIGLRAGYNTVTEASEQLRLELNEIGGRAGAVAEVAVTRGAGPRTIRIDGPFVVAINRNGMPANSDKVAFAAYVDRDSWRRPADGRI